MCFNSCCSQYPLPILIISETQCKLLTGNRFQPSASTPEPRKKCTWQFKSNSLSWGNRMTSEMPATWSHLGLAKARTECTYLSLALTPNSPLTGTPPGQAVCDLCLQESLAAQWGCVSAFRISASTTSVEGTLIGWGRWKPGCAHTAAEPHRILNGVDLPVPSSIVLDAGKWEAEVNSFITETKCLKESSTRERRVVLSHGFGRC